MLTPIKVRRSRTQRTEGAEAHYSQYAFLVSLRARLHRTRLRRAFLACCCASRDSSSASLQRRKPSDLDCQLFDRAGTVGASDVVFHEGVSKGRPNAREPGDRSRCAIRLRRPRLGEAVVCGGVSRVALEVEIQSVRVSTRDRSGLVAGVCQASGLQGVFRPSH